MTRSSVRFRQAATTPPWTRDPGGSLRRPGDPKSTQSPLALYRPATGPAFERITTDLTFAEWLGITGGQPFGGGGHHDRHNVLAAEVALRAGEYTQATAVLGEAFSTADLLVGEGVSGPPSKSAASADLTVVRPDGLRVAIELTATTSKHTRDKVRRWAKLLSESGDD